MMRRLWLMGVVLPSVVGLVLALSGCVIAIGNKGTEGRGAGGPGKPTARLVPTDAFMIGYGQSVTLHAPGRGTVFVVTNRGEELVYAAVVEPGEPVRIDGGHIQLGDRPRAQLQFIEALDERYEVYFRPMPTNVEPEGAPSGQ